MIGVGKKNKKDDWRRGYPRKVADRFEYEPNMATLIDDDFLSSEDD